MKFLLFIIFNILFVKINSQDKCHVLALQGGGDQGAYQAGALKGLAYNLPESERTWNIVTGISAGTLNGAGFSLFPSGKEIDAVDFLINVWKGIEDKNHIYQNWEPYGVFGPVYALFKESGIYDTTPLRELVTGILKGQKIQRDFYLGVVNIKSGDYEVYEAQKLTEEELVNAVLSSSAVPVIFPAIKFMNDDLYADGGVRHGIDIIHGISKCKENGYEEKDILVDAVLCFRGKLNEEDPTKLTALKAYMKSLEIFQKDRTIKDIQDIIDAHPNVNFRYIVKPTRALPNSKLPFVFDKAATEEMLKQGEEDAINIIKSFNSNSSSFKDEIKSEYKSTMESSIAKVSNLN